MWVLRGLSCLYAVLAVVQVSRPHAGAVLGAAAAASALVLGAAALWCGRRLRAGRPVPPVVEVYAFVPVTNSLLRLLLLHDVRYTTALMLVFVGLAVVIRCSASCVASSAPRGRHRLGRPGRHGRAGRPQHLARRHPAGRRGGHGVHDPRRSEAAQEQRLGLVQQSSPVARTSSPGSSWTPRSGWACRTPRTSRGGEPRVLPPGRPARAGPAGALRPGVHPQTRSGRSRGAPVPRCAASARPSEPHDRGSARSARQGPSAWAWLSLTHVQARRAPPVLDAGPVQASPPSRRRAGAAEDSERNLTTRHERGAAGAPGHDAGRDTSRPCRTRGGETRSSAHRARGDRRRAGRPPPPARADLVGTRIPLTTASMTVQVCRTPAPRFLGQHRCDPVVSRARLLALAPQHAP